MLFRSGKRGLRQGDPLSPFLFVLVMEMFTRRLLQASTSKGFSFHPRCKQLKLTSLAFADDLLIFCKPTPSSLKIIRRELDLFAADSGLIANNAKSCVFFGGLSADLRRDYAALLGFQLGHFPIRYLGAPLHSKRLRKGDFQPLLGKIQSAISSRQARHLSYAGRVQIINSVLQNVVGFWMQVIIFPKSVIHIIESLF